MNKIFEVTIVRNGKVQILRIKGETISEVLMFAIEGERHFGGVVVRVEENHWQSELN